ncbi:MAG: ATP-binding protein [Prochlorotrichaceae cyanobacterium]
MDAAEFKRFFKACNPNKTLNFSDPNDRQYYIDFAEVRGGEVISQMGDTIALENPDPTRQLFTGHIGCGKSTELSRLAAGLRDEGFVVISFDSSEELDMGDVDISDILLAIAHQVAKWMQQQQIRVKAGYLSGLVKEAMDLLRTPIEVDFEAEASLGIGPFSLGKVTAKTKESPQARSQLRQSLEFRTDGLITAINEELLAPVNQILSDRGEAGLVIIIDGLDRIQNNTIATGKTWAEQIFVTRGNQLSGLKCHVVYTIPLVLLFSNVYQDLKQRLGGGNAPVCLPMVPVQRRDGSADVAGLAQLRQMVLARAFPQLSDTERLERVGDLFEYGLEDLDHLCCQSGGHARNLMSLVFACLQKQRRTLPISRTNLYQSIQEMRDDLLLAVEPQEWELLRQVQKTQQVVGESQQQTLLHSLFVFEYRTEQDGRWFTVNPLLRDRLQSG